MLEDIGNRLRRPGAWQTEQRPTGTHALMQATQRELTLFAADMLGAQAHVGQIPTRKWYMRADKRLIRNLVEQADLPSLVIDPRAGLHIVDRSASYAAATLTEDRQIAGGKMFEVFPDNDDLAAPDGVGNLYDSLKLAAASGRPHVMAVQRYDVLSANGTFVEKHWLPTNTPIFDASGRLMFLLHTAVEITPDGAGGYLRVIRSGG